MWLRERRCAACVSLLGPKWANYGSDPAHTSNNGMASKGDDSSCVPLCREHHQEQHRIGMKDFEAKYGLDLKREAAAHWRVFCIAEGRDDG